MVIDEQFAARRRELDDLYADLWQWVRIHDPEAAVRPRVEVVDWNARLMLVGEAPAAGQGRRTGISWFTTTGKLGSAGRNLDLLLRCAGYTVYPPRALAVSDGQISARPDDLLTAYTMNIYPAYVPGGGAPTSKMLQAALAQGFLARAIASMQPSVIVLLGAKSYMTFYTELLHKPAPMPLVAAFTQLSPATPLAEYAGARVLPFLHPSPRNGHFMAWWARVRHALCETPQVQALDKVCKVTSNA